jgi:hypothetical protein
MGFSTRAAESEAADDADGAGSVLPSLLHFRLHNRHDYFNSFSSLTQPMNLCTTRSRNEEVT